VIVASLSNDTATNSQFPGQSNGVVSVQAIDSTGKIQSTRGVPNVNPLTDVAAPGVGILAQGNLLDEAWEQTDIINGTSTATPIVAGFLALVKQKYPKATGNQLIQTLIHNTGRSDHPLGIDPAHETGYGVASVTHMLKVDPTQYPDVNPLISTSPGQSPTAAQIAGTASGTASAVPNRTESPVPVWLQLGLIVGGVLALIVILAIVLTIVLVTRSRRRHP